LPATWIPETVRPIGHDEPESGARVWGRSQNQDRRYHFDAAYCERAKLGDGSNVTLRLIQPSDKEALQRGFEQLSAQSRYLRFFCLKTRLTDAELNHLVNVDGVNHLAIVALSSGDSNEVEILGVARFARLQSSPTVAEPAVTVGDQVQGRGLGTLLMSRLAAAARERGIERFACDYLAENQPIQALLEKYARSAVFEQDGDVIRAEVAVPDIPPTGKPSLHEQGSVIFRLLAESARGAIEIRLRHLILKTRGR
jgi:RimJ/RimL family protein N-acetyltransferase